MMRPMCSKRRNLVHPKGEAWQPPRFRKHGSDGQRFLEWVRRVGDLQAASIWSDVKRELAGAEGDLLDVGCGHQPYRRLLPPGVQYQGLDTLEAQEHFGYSLPGTLIVSGYPWPLPDESFDVILCTEVAEHVLDPAALLAEIRRCLKPDGRLILTVPFAARWHFLPHDYWRFTPSGLDHLLRAAGFTDPVVHGRGNPLTVACQKVLALLPPLVAPSGGTPGRRLAGGAAAIALLPAAAVAGVLGQISLRRDWGEDFLGYTVVAHRAPLGLTNRRGWGETPAVARNGVYTTR